MKSSITNKKAQAQNIAPAVIALFIAGILLVFGIIMLQSTRDMNIVDQASSTTVLNESHTLNDTTYNMDNVGDRGANTFSVIVVQNSTSGAIVPSTNYTFSSAGTIVAKAGFYNGTTVNVSYSYLHGDQTYVAANSSVLGIATFADFWEIIVLAIIISIVMALILSAFGARRER